MVARLTLWGKGIGQRTQYWAAGYPWWVKWEKTADKAAVEEGPLRARMVMFGKKGKPGTKVDVNRRAEAPSGKKGEKKAEEAPAKK